MLVDDNKMKERSGAARGEITVEVADLNQAALVPRAFEDPADLGAAVEEFRKDKVSRPACPSVCIHAI